MNDIEKVMVYSEPRKLLLDERLYKNLHVISENGALLASALIKWGVNMVTYSNLEEIPQNIGEYHVVLISSLFMGNVEEAISFIKKIKKQFPRPIIVFKSKSAEHDLSRYNEALIDVYQNLDGLMDKIADIIKKVKAI